MWGIFLKNTSIIAAIVSLLVAVDLLLGARVLIGLKRILEKPIEIDKTILSSKIRIVLAIIFIILSILIFLLVKQV